ncbi:uncharacterized protein LOC131434143 [Malaya genurostris]|uniref:uncharacterized protein LOC131434143 n=1 Tax=Malaya genurostris TaxID=325434 RepID=UPI0026F3D8AA|nr:uncharacterized protein LOC131434143 [Malaya genurostris]
MVPLAAAIVTGVCGLIITSKNPQFFTASVVNVCSLLRYSTVTLVHYLSYFLFLSNRTKVYALLKGVIRFDRDYLSIPNAGHNIEKVMFIVILALYNFRIYDAVIFFGSMLIEFYFYIQNLFVLLFVELIMVRYRMLHRTTLKTRNRNVLLTLLKLHDHLGVMKELITKAFGAFCMITSVVVFVQSAIIAYCLLWMWQQKISTGLILMASINLPFNVIFFFGWTYSFDLLEHEEQEFKNAIKSLQYRSTEDQPASFSEFLDIIDLKLLTESPKITACGLFSINLTVFCNVFTAIVTYIMILFQFKDLEK